MFDLDKDDFIGIVLYGVIWGIPILLMIFLTLRGEVPWGVIVFYEIPALISLIELRPWKKRETSSFEFAIYVRDGSLPWSSRTSRFIMALMPGINILIAFGAVQKWMKN